MILWIILIILLFWSYSREEFTEYECQSNKPICYRCDKNQGCIQKYYSSHQEDTCELFVKKFLKLIGKDYLLSKYKKILIKYDKYL